MPPKRLLVVEDQKDILLMEETILSKSGYTVDAVVSAADALKMMENQKYDLVISDLMMPGMDGFELIKLIRERHETKIPVLWVTAMEGALKKGSETGVKASAILKKPFTSNSLLTSVRILIGDSGASSRIHHPPPPSPPKEQAPTPPPQPIDTPTDKATKPLIRPSKPNKRRLKKPTRK